MKSKNFLVTGYWLGNPTRQFDWFGRACNAGFAQKKAGRSVRQTFANRLTKIKVFQIGN